MAKTAETVRQRCKDERCLTNLAGHLQNCLALATGDTADVCSMPAKHVEVVCASDRVSLYQCASLKVMVQLACDASVVAEEGELAARDIFRLAAPSVVVVLGVDARGDVVTQGSGVVVSHGVVATNCHVLFGSYRPIVKFEEDYFDATVKHSDIERDVCTIATPTLPALAIDFPLAGSMAVRIGDEVYAVGAPSGLELTLSNGLISGKRHEDVGTYLQTTTPISPGSSGGGLFDQEARLIGLTTMYLKDGQQLNFAIPVEWINELPERDATPENRQKAMRFAIESLNRLGEILSQDDPLFQCKKAVAMPQAKSSIRTLSPFHMAANFKSIYDRVDSSICED